MKRCVRCNLDKPLALMCRDGMRNGVQRYRSICKACRRIDYRVNSFGREVPWKDRLAKIKTRAAQKGIECTITASDLEHIWDVQKGLCVYTQERMMLGYGLRNHPQGVSVDRINPAEGYVPGNIVLCSQRANTIKQDMTVKEFELWMPVWHQRLHQLLWRISNEGS